MFGIAPSIDPSERQNSAYRWVILVLVTLSGFLVMGFPTTGLSAMFSEIADSLGLDLIEIGVIWGIGTGMGIFTSLLGGAFIDVFGTRRTLVASLPGHRGIRRAARRGDGLFCRCSYSHFSLAWCSRYCP